MMFLAIFFGIGLFGLIVTAWIAGSPVACVLMFLLLMPLATLAGAMIFTAATGIHAWYSALIGFFPAIPVSWIISYIPMGIIVGKKIAKHAPFLASPIRPTPAALLPKQISGRVEPHF